MSRQNISKKSKLGGRELVSELLLSADIKINGDRPWDIQVKDERFYGRVLRQGSLGFGESYMDGWWECEALDKLISRVMRADLVSKLKISPHLMLSYISSIFFNQGAKSRAFEIGEKHYDIGNELYRVMLDSRMIYTCGYWKDASNLDEAQEAKLDIVCRKIGLRPGQKVLDIGCGWGSFVKFAAEKYGAKAVGITVSKEQAELARQNCYGFPVEIRFQDYREVNEQFDHIVSLGMFEHIGYKNYHTYMEIVHHCLKENGLFLLHTIGRNTSGSGTDPWIAKYIFPNSMLPSIKQIGKSIEGLFVMEDWHNFSADYDKTLMAWYNNFESAWPNLRANYGDRFYRMWRFYLLACAGTFRARRNQLWQIILSPRGVPGGYNSSGYNLIR